MCHLQKRLYLEVVELAVLPEEILILQQIGWQCLFLSEESFQFGDSFLVLARYFIALDQFLHIIRQDVTQLISGVLLQLFEIIELFVFLGLTDELRRDGIREDEDPSWEEDFTAWNDEEERKGHESEEIPLYLSQPPILFV